MTANQSNAKSGKRKAAKARPPTIYDGDKYFDAKFTQDELWELERRILAECGFEDDFNGRSWLTTQWITLGHELGRKLGLSDMASIERVTIYMCRELEIDYKSFAKNIPKLPIEPFYRFVASRFPHFKPANNKMRLDVQLTHLRSAFVDWVEAECQRTSCPKSYHGSGCEDRYEQPNYMTALQRVYKHNAERPKLTLVHSD